MSQIWQGRKGVEDGVKDKQYNMLLDGRGTWPNKHWHYVAQACKSDKAFDNSCKHGLRSSRQIIFKLDRSV